MYGEQYREGYWLVRGVDMAGGDTRDEGIPNLDEGLNRAVGWINGDPKKVTGLSKDHIWYKILRSTTCNASGNHSWVYSVFFGKALTLGITKKTKLRLSLFLM